MAAGQNCPLCGQRIPAPGVCYRCAQEGRDPGRVTTRPPAILPAPIRCTAHLRRGINRFLAAVSGEPWLVSEILADGGFEPAEIARLRAESGRFLPRLVHGWIGEWSTHLEPWEITALVRAYGLDGRPPAGYEVWDEMTASALARLQGRLRRARLERVVLVVAEELLAEV